MHYWLVMNRIYQVITGSFKGKGKRINEDGVFVFSEDDYLLLVVLDGVGSARGAKKSVAFAKKYLAKNFRNSYIKGYFDLGGLLKMLNNAILNSGIEEAYSACVMLYLPLNDRKNVKHVNLGDSRVYSVGKQYFSKISTDHALPGSSNVITKYLGKEDLCNSDYREHICTTHENRFFLCTDGVYSQIENLGEDLSKFHNVLFYKYMKRIQNGIKSFIYGNNTDDASYIYVRLSDV